ncbi:MAG: nuclear transport factor 2 family protein [Rhodospirillaceae bacterium]|nr:nuclear transport factor 2 family protein [Rhodospirillaceae bacterium]
MFKTVMERRLAVMVGLLALPAVYGAYALSASAVAADTVKTQVVQDTSKFSQIKPDVLAMIEKGEADFLAKDPQRLGDSITEDFTWYRVMPEGPKLAVQGRENTVKMLSQFFTDTPAGYQSKVYRLAMVGNILVQVEVDKYDSKTEGKVEKTSLEIYEFRDGRRFREWRFAPTATPFDK